MPNPTQLDHLEELLTKASLPWRFDHDWYRTPTVIGNDSYGVAFVVKDGFPQRDSRSPAQDANATLIVGAINALPSLIADLRAMREALEDIAEHATVRRQDGIELGATVWRIALEDIVRDARRALAK